MTHLDIIRTCKASGCTSDQAKAQFRANTAQLRINEDKARILGGMYRGYTADEWKAKADRFELVASEE